MRRHYKTKSPWERDAIREAAARTRQENRMAREIQPRDDMRMPWALVMGDWLRWTVHPDKRHVRRWWAVDDSTGEPVRNEDDSVFRAGVDRIIRRAAEVLPRRMLGRAHWDN